ncbi:MAG TPA: Rid family detoxifying hydrolase [Treponemataceae bacterium]|nr:Rid family detoxifying hydrolase [Treponemataceae bacterium]
MKRKAIIATGAAAIGPYSHAIEIDGFVYLSGQTPIDSKTGKLVEGDIKEQTEQSFKNLFNVLSSARLSSDDVIKVNVFLTEMKNFSEMNEVYKTKFTDPFPARTTIGVKELPLGAMIEIEMIAKR